MALQSLISNVVTKRIVLFLGSASVISVLVNLIPFRIEYRVAIFGIVIFTFSLCFPVVFSELEQQSADFWYYTLAMIGVFLFFIDEGEKERRFA